MRHSPLIGSSNKEAQASTQEVPRSGQTLLWASALAESIGTFGLVFADPISRASMNPARSLGPALVSITWTAQWVYVSAPFVGAIAGALLYRWMREAGPLPPSSPAQEVHPHD